jgi:hypothetical protein
MTEAYQMTGATGPEEARCWRIRSGVVIAHIRRMIRNREISKTERRGKELEMREEIPAIRIGDASVSKGSGG